MSESNSLLAGCEIKNEKDFLDRFYLWKDIEYKTRAIYFTLSSETGQLSIYRIWDGGTLREA